ncbi:MAG: response regulator MprA [Parcubacteria group bacterium]|jgi:uncharacterized membrane protein (UPF0127 family)|nr:response regulator MprA [Parcubacteria group bacterium]
MYEGVDTAHKRQYVRYGIVAFVVLGALVGWAWYAHPMSDSHLSIFPTATTTPSSAISYEIVTSTADQERGLGGRANIPPDYAMLFVFPKDGTYGFWMKDMLATIDMIWLSDNGTVVHLEQNVAPSTYPHVFYPNTPARYVLEMRAGQAAARDLGIGSKISLPLPYGK